MFKTSKHGTHSTESSSLGSCPCAHQHHIKMPRPHQDPYSTPCTACFTLLVVLLALFPFHTPRVQTPAHSHRTRCTASHCHIHTTANKSHSTMEQAPQSKLKLCSCTPFIFKTIHGWLQKPQCGLYQAAGPMPRECRRPNPLPNANKIEQICNARVSPHLLCQWVMCTLPRVRNPHQVLSHTPTTCGWQQPAQLSAREPDSMAHQSTSTTRWGPRQPAIQNSYGRAHKSIFVSTTKGPRRFDHTNQLWHVRCGQ
mmetsp:Transcript_24658/g.53844  ORF Transcript_24658/g.53844 Transcript_24658/m.53844 type:complete len:254 (+) Transcript_24658:131-892(+)